MEHPGKQYKKIIQLTFPPEHANKPVMCHMVRQYDVIYNIVAAQTTPGKDGYLTVELSGEDAACQAALQYVREQGIIVALAHQHVSRDEESCMHCGMCIAMCPVDALSVAPSTRMVLFDEDKCTACGMCVRICPVKAMVADEIMGIPPGEATA